MHLPSKNDVKQLLGIGLRDVLGAEAEAILDSTS